MLAEAADPGCRGSCPWWEHICITHTRISVPSGCGGATIRLQVGGGGEDNVEEDGKCGAQAGRCLVLGEEWKMQLERTEGLAPFPFDHFPFLPEPLLHCLTWLSLDVGWEVLRVGCSVEGQGAKASNKKHHTGRDHESNSSAQLWTLPCLS